MQKHSFPEEVLADFKAGNPVQIIYLPDDPSTFVFAREEPGWPMVIGGLALMVAALLFAWWVAPRVADRPQLDFQLSILVA